jgi:hypothetical protein
MQDALTVKTCACWLHPQDRPRIIISKDSPVYNSVSRVNISFGFSHQNSTCLCLSFFPMLAVCPTTSCLSFLHTITIIILGKKKLFVFLLAMMACRRSRDITVILINPLNAELNPICHLLIILGGLTFMGPCIVNIFKYTCISSKMQRYTVYLYLETALHVSGGTSTHHQKRIQLYLQHLVFVTPLLLPAAIVEELEPV